MPDRDNYRTDQNRWDRPLRDPEARRTGADLGWSSASEGRSFADRDAGAPYGGRYPRDGRGGQGYGGQGAYGQGPGPGGYGYGANVTGWDQDSSGDRFGQRDPDYDRGGQGGYGRYGADPLGGEWNSGARQAHAEGRYDDRGGSQLWSRGDRSPRYGRSEFDRQPDQALHRVTEGDHHEHAYRRWRDAQLEAHDRDYAHWREQQARRYDDDYGQWRNQRHEAFSKDFEGWRNTRGEREVQQTQGAPINPPEVENVTDGRKPSEERTD
jgi:hypothetical protein